MHRRRYLALLGTLSIAGCSTTSDTPTGTPTETTPPSPTAPTETETPPPADTPTESPTATETERATATPVFNPVIYYDTCDRVTVQASRYDRVTLYFEDAVQQFTDGYRGTHSFAGTGQHEGRVVYEANVSLGEQTVERPNPTLSDCLSTPTPEPTETPTATPQSESDARRGLDVFSYKRVGSEPYEVFIRIENENNYAVQAFVTTEFFGSDGDRYDIQYDFERLGRRDEVELVHRYDGPDDKDITDHTVTVDAERAD